MGPGERDSLVATCLTIASLSGMFLKRRDTAAAWLAPGISATTTTHNMGSPISGAPIVIRVITRIRLFDYFEQEGVPNLYLSNAPGMTLYENTLEFGTIDDPRQQRTTWTVDRSIEFIQGANDAPFFLFASIKDPHPRILVPPELLEYYPEDQMPLSSSLRDPLDGKPEFQTGEENFGFVRR